MSEEPYRQEVTNKWNAFKSWVQQNSPTRYTFSYRVEANNPTPITGRANSFGEVRSQLGAARTKPFQMISITAWNDKQGSYNTVSQSKEFEANVMSDLLSRTFI